MTLLTLRPAPIFEPLWRAKGIRYLGAKGGRASGKSHFFAEMLVARCIAQPGTRAICAREVQKKLKESAKKLIEDKIEAMGGAERLGFECLATETRTPGGGLIAYEGMQNHTIDGLKSFEGADIAWIEEAQSLSERTLKVFIPTIIRNPTAQVWCSWNPRKRSDAVEKMKWDDKGRSVLVHANYLDNPFLDPSVIEEIESNREDDDFAHVWLGGYETMGSKVVIPAAWIEAAIGLAEDLGLDVTGRMFSALDVAGAEEGGDENAQAIRKGIELQFLDKWNGYDTSETTHKAVANAKAHDCTDLFYDSAGVGEGVTGEWGSMGRRGDRPKGMTLTAWNGGMSVLDPDKRLDPRNPKSPKNRDHYANLKSQSWFAFRERCENAWKARAGKPYDADMLVSIPRDLPYLQQLQDELTQPQHKLSASGKVMVDKQPDGAKSPNLADSVVMCYWPLDGGYNLEFWRS